MTTRDELNTTPAWRNEMRRKRKSLGWTQADLAQRCGVQQITISHIEIGRIQKSAAIGDIAEVLEIDLPTPRLGEHEALWLRLGKKLREEQPELYEAQVALYRQLLASVLDKSDIGDPEK